MQVRKLLGQNRYDFWWGNLQTQDHAEKTLGLD